PSSSIGCRMEFLTFIDIESMWPVFVVGSCANLPDRLLVVMQERKHIVLLQLCAWVKEVELHHKSQAGDVCAKRFRQLCRGFRSAAGGQQVVHNQHALSFFNCVAMDFESIGAVLKRVV